MHKSIRKLVAMVLLLALPLQGLSAVLMPFHCPPDKQHDAIAVGAQQHHESVAHDHDSTLPATDQHGGNPSSNEAGHFCCDHVYTGAPSVADLAAPDTPFVTINKIHPVPPPFFPERLLRPPRA